MLTFSIISSNINEAIKTTLNFFIQKFHNHEKAQNAYKRIKIKNAPKKYLRGKWSFIRLFAFCAFARMSLCLLVLLVLLTLLVLFVRAKCFRKKKIKKFKTALITSFILLLNFQLSQSFSIIKIFFNYYNLFQLSQSFSIIMIFFNYHNLFYYNLFQSLYNL